MSQKIYLTILKIGVYLSLLSVFLVSSKLLFPFITSKQIYFNILIEILLIFWIAFIIKYPEFRPKKSWISIGLISFLLVILISCFTSIDFNLSFWGDVERMLGFFHILHFLFLYFIIITVMRSWKDWKIFFIFSIICAVIVSFYGLATKHYSTIGNTAYVSGYLIFNIYFAFLLFFREKNKGLRWIYLISIPIMLLEFKKANTSGAYVGLGFGIMVLFFLLGALAKNKKNRIYFLTAFAALVLLAGLLIANKESDFVKNNSVLRVVNGISFQKRTFQTRLISWKAAAKDFKNHPILGTGHGNYAITFDKYFDPKFYSFTRNETYFDRAHNNLIDIASTTGTLGILAYLSIFAAVGYYLIKGLKDDRISLIEFSLISSLVTAYFIQNLAVFDSLVTYICLMMILGYVYWLYSKEEEKIEKGEPLNNKEIYTLIGAGIILLAIVYQYNIKPLKMLIGTIDGQRVYAQEKDLEKAMEICKGALGYDTVLDRDGRNSCAQLVSQNSNVLKSIKKEKADEIVDYAISLTERNLEYNKNDSLTQLQLAHILNIAADFNKENQEDFLYYSYRAEEAVDRSIQSSPGRVTTYFQKAQIYISRGEKNKALDTLKYAVSLNDKFFDSVCMFAKVQIFYNVEGGLENMDKCIDLNGAQILYPASFITQMIDDYTKKEDWERTIKLYRRLTSLESENPKIWTNLANIYVKVDDKENAIKAAEKVAELDPGLQDDVDNFIRSLEK